MRTRHEHRADRGADPGGSTALPGFGQGDLARNLQLCHNEAMESFGPVQDAPDAELAKRIPVARGLAQRRAEEELCRRFLRRVRLYGRKHLREPFLVDELGQRVMAIVIEKLRAGMVRDPEQIASYVLGVARLQSKEIARDGARTQELLDHHLEGSVAQAPDLDHLGLQRVPNCLARLDERMRSVLVLTFFEQQTAQEIARVWAMTESHVRVLRHRAIEQLRGCVEGRDAES